MPNGSKSLPCSTEIAPRKVVGRPFVKGDPRCWRKGRPKSFDQLRELAQEISHREIKSKDGESITLTEAVLLKLAEAKDPQSLKTFLEFSFGKVPDELKATGLESKPVLILHYAHERQNAEQN